MHNLQLENLVMEIRNFWVHNKEICGIVSTSAKVIPIPNVSSSPNTFIMDKSTYLKNINDLKVAGDSVLALYHTHLFSGPEPSIKDLEFHNKSNVGMLIISSKGYAYYE